MDEIRRILVIILCGISAVSTITIKVSESYCRDPDTGKLHPINSTWSSTTFCGNYTCKLRQKTPHRNELLRQYNITNLNVNQTSEARHDNIKNDADFAASNITPQTVPLIRTSSSGDTEHLRAQFQDELNNLQQKINVRLDKNSGDRFLTDTEIKTISDLLHNMKKSDLEAIVDIYNLAQDIYKEMDKMTSENILDEAIRVAQSTVQSGNSNKKHTSYWYEPVNKFTNIEVKPDMQQQGTHPVSATVQPKTESPDMYFSGPLSSNDFRKLPYYYPMSSFQRQSSYVHPGYLPQPQVQLPPVNVKPPCATQSPVPVAYRPPVHYNNYPSPQPSYPVTQNPPPQAYPLQNYGAVIKRPFAVETQGLIQPSVLLPYPFSYVQHYNMSSYPFNFYYAESPWRRFDFNTKNDNTPKDTKTQSPKDTKAQSPNAVQPTAEKNKKESTKSKTDVVDKLSNILDGNLLENLLANAKIINIKKPDWQTDPISDKVLEEVRAHFEEKAKLLKPFPLRKKIKLERVGKVVKLDGLDLHREKRSSDLQYFSFRNVEKLEKENDSETYIEKTTCQSEVDPGFYKMGNLSEPFPGCCPRKIDGNR